MTDSPAKHSVLRPSDSRQSDPARFDVANRVFFRLYQCANLMHKVGARFIGDFNSTTQQWAVLGALARPEPREHGMTVKDLIAFLLVSRQNITPVLDRLEARGWIERIKDAEDGRSRRIVLTTAGDLAWSEMQIAIDAFYREALEGLDLDEQVVLYRLLDRLKARLNTL
ncbi:DNA-binding MarR family transcriptional regulator [Pseudochelatococcus lubricantis]|uniref:DNA-binding MarR family transcriptional regulator n=1 Tax=Pseudochelatococcus lubricantis TaxID=1538102 RepID=A0ABX0UZL6_9HYPH|nr:MarR family transcriptional regulator [Pseudochelatococcus lubricantis]NIJ58399.1 DNA-binding MarR family transcriptional regulator [Pseudochelatococcus lubricantis]